MSHKDKEQGLFVRKRLTPKDLKVGLYDVLEHFKPLIPFLNRLLKSYRLYYPWDSKECAGLAVTCILKIYGLSAIVFLIIFGTSPSLFSVILSGYLIYVFSSEIINSSRVKLEIQFLKAFENVLGNIRHHYYKSGSIRNALADAENDADPIIKGHIKEMIIFLISLFLLLPLGIYSQTGKLFDADKQLSSSFTTQVYLDRDGFLWVATRNGLNRYDGYQFLILKKESRKDLGMASNYVNCMMQDHNGLFYVGMYGAFQTYDGERFQDVKTYSTDGTLVPCYVTTLLERHNGDILVGTSVMAC